MLQYTDDTAMAIALAEALIENNGNLPDVEKIRKKFHEHYRKKPWRGHATGPPLIFQVTELTGNSYAEIAGSLFGGTGSFGNGTAMRITPLGMLCFNA